VTRTIRDPAPAGFERYVDDLAKAAGSSVSSARKLVGFRERKSRRRSA
jgi:hypothetical protein